jgi:hypothetical protein
VPAGAAHAATYAMVELEEGERPAAQPKIRPNEDKIRPIEIAGFVRVDVQDFSGRPCACAANAQQRRVELDR